MRFAQVATRVWGCQMDFEHPENTALAGIRCFRRFLSSIGMPINFEQLGAKESDIPLLAKKMGINGTTGGFVKLTTADVEAILRIAAKATV